jgi:hypothetical protein
VKPSVLFGAIAALQGAFGAVILWTAIAALADRPLPFMAVLVGLGTGAYAKVMLRGFNFYCPPAIAAGVTLFGCAGGTIYSEAAVVAKLRASDILTYIAHMPLFVAVYTAESYFSFADILWCALSVAVAWILSRPRGLRRTALPPAEMRAPGAAT